MFFQILVLALLKILYACQLAGQEIGECAQKSVFETNSFCGESVAQQICIPLKSIVWPYSSVSHRDQTVKDIFIYYVENRLLSEYIHRNSTEILSNNNKCYQAYKKFLCQFNFPACSSNQSTPICYSVCQNFYTSCLSSSDACDIIYLNKFPGLDINC